ncbi:MAG: VOC family protein [Myxococcota bacterium]|nr:VOC family protein [Myxococcota bacterium]MDW8364113.1 VOC family protein [Myxococcales bacterium]
MSGTSKAEADPIGYDGGLTCSMHVTGLDRAIAWHRDVLGFRLRYRLDEMGWCELATPVHGVSVGLSRQPHVAPEGGATLVFGVRDIEVARRNLEARGVDFDGPTSTIEGMVRLATFRDPDGNILMLYQDLGGLPG